jgi:N-methylhydantoinase A
MHIVAALDIGGTFTDLVYWDAQEHRFGDAKSATTPKDLSIGILNCIEKADLAVEDLSDFVHGSTIAINTVLERTGAATALIVTEGTRDAYSMGRGNRPQAYNMFFHRPRPLVPRRRTFEVDERLLADGSVYRELAEDSIARVVAEVAEANVEAIAVCLIHSYANSAHEERLGAALSAAFPNKYISLSHMILREYREYERTSTTVLNSYVGPRVSAYVEQIEQLLNDRHFGGKFFIMRSNGGVMSPESAKHVPVAMMESGPVGGIAAAAALGRRLGFESVIAFDMGGTTAKASLISDGVPAIAEGYFIGGYAEGQPLMLPVVDVVEVGTGGGSIARIDEVGALRVGPESAGGDPGPICYGWGGTEPTVTDANLVLGRLGAGRFLGGEMPLDRDAAAEGIDRLIGQAIASSVSEAAYGIIEIAHTTMSLAVRSVSIERGFDPRNFAMVAFGGAGGLHACAIARDLNIPTVIVPLYPGHFSAVGMLESEVRHDYVRTVYGELGGLEWTLLNTVVDDFLESGRTQLEEDSIDAEGMSFDIDLDLRYAHQDFTLATRVSREDLRERNIDGIRTAFHEAHKRRFHHSAEDDLVELVNVRVSARGRRDDIERSYVPDVGDPRTGSREVYLLDNQHPVDVPIYWRSRMQVGSEIVGPAVIEEYASTALLLPGDILHCAPTGELIIDIAAENA